MINIFLNSTLLGQESQLSYASALFLLGLICHEPDPPISMVQVLPMLIAIGLTISDSMKRRRLGAKQKKWTPLAVVGAMFSLGISKSPGTLIFGRAVWAQASWILWSEGE